MNTFAPRAPSPAGTASPYRRTTPTLMQVVGAALWASLEAVGQRRARHELTALARRWAPFDPELASRLRQAACGDAPADGHARGLG